MICKNLSFQIWKAGNLADKVSRGSELMYFEYLFWKEISGLYEKKFH
jgi:hypothetical protein